MKFSTLLIATGFGSGYGPKAPGTWGSLVGAVLIWMYQKTGYANWILLLGVLCLGTITSHLAEQYLGEHDSPKIVIDEIAGILVSCLYLPPIYILPAFLLFRFFDVLKPGPIGNIQHLPGGLGVMADDILAGLTTLIILKAFILIW